MLRTYWLTFRLEDDIDYERRYSALGAVIRFAMVGTAWEEPTSFVMFQSRLSPSDLKARIAGAIDELVDVVVLAHVGVKEMYVIGHTDNRDNLRKMVPYLK